MLIHDCTGHMWKVRWWRDVIGTITYQNDYCYPGLLSYEETIKEAANELAERAQASRTVFVTKFYEPRRNTTHQGLRRNPFQRL